MVHKAKDQRFLYLAWTISLGGIFGSLFFSEILKFPPCTLCWYQRIFLYPLGFIFVVGILKRDLGVVTYSLPFILAGLGTAIYHNLYYYGLIAQSFSTCTGEVACNAKQLELFGFITIPLLSLVSFATLAALIFFHYKTNKSMERAS